MQIIAGSDMWSLLRRPSLRRRRQPRLPLLEQRLNSPGVPVKSVALIILWDVDPNDWKEPGVNVVAQRIISGTRPGSIVLSHDIHAPTIEAMPRVFDALLAKGFKFVTVSELIAMDKRSAKPNNSLPAPAYGKPETSSSTNTPSARAPFSPTTKP